jgi:hypothetical protein
VAWRAAAATRLGGAAGTALAAFLQRSADRRAAQAQAAALFTQIVKAITVMETEKIVFRDRRTGLHANLRAIGNVALQVLAGHAAGNWPAGAASGISGLAAWDAAEGARFTDRYFAARAEATTALVQLSLMSDALQKAAGEISDALDALGSARKARDREAAGKQISEAVAGLRTAVRDYCAGMPEKRGKHKPPALPAAQLSHPGGGLMGPARTS